MGQDICYDHITNSMHSKMQNICLIFCNQDYAKSMILAFAEGSIFSEHNRCQNFIKIPSGMLRFMNSDDE